MKVGNLAFSTRDDSDAEEGHEFVKTGCGLMVAGQTIQSLCHDHFELVIARMGQQALVFGSQVGRA